MVCERLCPSENTQADSEIMGKNFSEEKVSSWGNKYCRWTVAVIHHDLDTDDEDRLSSSKAESFSEGQMDSYMTHQDLGT